MYSVFCVMSLAALAVSVIYYTELVGGKPTQGVKQYYAGESPARAGTSKQAPAASDGPTIELPDEDPAAVASSNGKMIVRISKRKLLEVTHFHLFTVPVFLLIISHLFMLCGIRPSLKLAILITGLASTSLHLLAPWLIYWGGGAWAWTMPVSGALMGTSMTVMTSWPCVVMWRRPPAK